MKYLISIILSLVLVFPALASEFIGTVVFYSYPDKAPQTEEEIQDEIEVEADFTYHVEGLFKYLDKYRIKYTVERKSNFQIKSINGRIIEIERKDLPITTGYVMVKADGSYRIENGMGTGADMFMDIVDFFQLKVDLE